MPFLEFTISGLPVSRVQLAMEEGYCAHVGRAESADICIPDPSVSSAHGLLTRVLGGYMLTDEGSTNGIVYQSQRVLQLMLNEPIEFYLGSVNVHFIASPEEIAQFKQEKAARKEQEFVDLNDLHLDNLPPAASNDGIPAQSRRINTAPAVLGIRLPDIDAQHPELGQLHYASHVSRNDEPEAPATTAPSESWLSRNSNYPIMVAYAIIMFVLGIGTGVTYQYYLNTGELLPMELLGIHSPKQTLMLHKKQAQDELKKAQNARTADRKQP